ncbi:lytic polysaccharide monooxygenase auxiliary activity family 9 protein [Actinomadura flavalba]|uniref:lytic polysaccharide monooxygenase auxiliary activity family 9 protein n=1 Tax=Actinomadura flavalba TaxID=1120938 RepID=UPI0003678835|nr:lytic polysaccharide monooxygenase [Actinomadura flavalba]
MKPRTALRRTGFGLLALAPAGGLALAAAPADAHGSMENPVSRVLACRLENPESPTSAACKAAVAAGGTQAFYDWNGVRIGNADGRHRQLIPDGKLCSAGDPAFRGLDLARADWPSTALTSGASTTFRFKATAQHRGGFQLYITRNGYDASKPLTWSDLETTPFLTKADPAVVNGAYTMPGTVPAGKTGRHLIYAIWQRTDSPEAFYSCSDVTFGGASTGGGAAQPAPAKPVATKTSAPRPSAEPTKEPCAPAAAHAHHDDVTLNASPAAGSTAEQGADPFGTFLITATAGLAMGGVGGLLLTGRRRRAAGQHTRR